MSELGPNAHGELLDPGRVGDCSLGLPLALDDDEQGRGGVLVVAPRWLLDPQVPQPAGSLVYELATGHPDRTPRELVFPADLTVELRAWPQARWASLGVDLQEVAGAVVGCWRRGDVGGLPFRLEAGEHVRALVRPAMTVAREALRARLHRQVARQAPLAGTQAAGAGPATASCSALAGRAGRRTAARRRTTARPADTAHATGRLHLSAADTGASGAVSAVDGARVRPWTPGWLTA